MTEVVFWLSAAVVLYTFLVYPAFVSVVGIVFGRRSAYRSYDEGCYPDIAIIIAACNEAEHIRDRLERLETVKYPGKRETIVVTDDGSVDGTIAIVKELASNGSVRHLHCEKRGKNACMDFGVASTDAEILVFKDASGLFADETLLRLSTPFQNSKVGCVGGAVVFQDNGHIGAIERVYWVVELCLRRGTEVLGYLPSAAGGIHAMRRELYRPVPNDITRDMVDPIQAVVQGQTAIKEDAAVCYEIPWRGVGDVYRNRIRVTKRAWAAIHYNARELWAAGQLLVLWQLVSHKVLRFLVWVPMITTFLASLHLGRESRCFFVLAVIQLTLYAGCALSLWISSTLGKLIPVASLFGFLMLNLVAMADGTVRFLVGRRSTTWKH